MEAFRAKGPGAIPRRAQKGGGDPVKHLGDPLVWEIFRKLLAHKKLRDDVAKLASGYPDPAQE